MKPSRYAVAIFAGDKRPELVKFVGPFLTPDDAKVWVIDRAYPITPAVEEWALIVPAEEPTWEPPE